MARLTLAMTANLSKIGIYASGNGIFGGTKAAYHWRDQHKPLRDQHIPLNTNGTPSGNFPETFILWEGQVCHIVGWTIATG